MPTEQIREAREILSQLSDADKRFLAAEFGLKIPIGWRGILADGKLPATFAGWIVASAATWQMMKTTGDAGAKLAYFNTWMYASSGVWSALMVAMGYQKGKANEGTVPEGRMAIPQFVAAPVVSAVPAPIAAIVPIETPNGPALPLMPAPVQPRKAGDMRTMMLLPFLLCLSFVGGCVTTSPLYKIGAFQSVPVAVTEVREYDASHNWDANGDGVTDENELKAKRAADESLNALAASVMVQKNISAPVVAERFAEVEPRYRRYIENDPDLIDPVDRMTRLGLPDVIAATTRKELARQAAAARGWMQP